MGPRECMSREHEEVCLSVDESDDNVGDIWLACHENMRFKKIIIFTKTQFNNQIKCIRSDNGFEFTSLQPILSTLGILLQALCTVTQQQHGVAERKH